MSDAAAASVAPPAGPLDEGTATELLRITRTMVTAARANDWSTVTRHDRARRMLLEATPASVSGVSSRPLPAALVEALAAADRSLLEHARRVRDLAGEDTHRVRAERDARDTYCRVMDDNRFGGD